MMIVMMTILVALMSHLKMRKRLNKCLPFKIRNEEEKLSDQSDDQGCLSNPEDEDEGGHITKHKLAEFNKDKDMKNPKLLEGMEGTIFEVTSVDKTFVVDIEEHTCTCRRCDLSGIPCIHGCAAIISQKAQPEDYVNKAYTTDTFVRTYSHRIKPILDKSLWPQTECDPRMPPPLRMQFGGQRRLGEKERMSPIILSRLGSKYYYHVQTMWTIWVQWLDWRWCATNW
ncbi:hypothetical protein RHMOL_Rhmol02G0155000 [Rhododendron molle]|uniref:Uncharacterized protein n=1 Tax=Rhododendron molle TaxID=49168 RepID=A0ACC0PRV1_RHOML|nr:hypothetical protein RHMOL_Rhmol02G0155000 [Rhododendron molle]